MQQDLRPDPAQPCQEPFRVRRAAVGVDDAVAYERAFLEVDECTWVVVREARAQGQAPVLHRCFEAVANAIHQELVLLRKQPDRLRFFHLYYEMKGGQGVQWNAREVLFIRRQGIYSLGTWVSIRPETWEQFNAAWSLSSQQPSRHL